MMLGLARQFPQALRSQLGEREWPYLRLRGRATLLRRQVVLLVGYGAIATRLSELLSPFGLEIIAFRRSVRGDERVMCLPIAQIDQHLPRADHVVNILPLNDQTRSFFNAERLKRIKPAARLYNIGRGDTVDQDALAAALGAGLLDAAYLDVTSPEPLPPTHPLWSLDNCFITPHTGGGFAGENQALVDHFLSNLARFLSGREVVDRVA
jgi:phosphoglycerate dehydrogenase-like enzyme